MIKKWLSKIKRFQIVKERRRILSKKKENEIKKLFLLNWKNEYKIRRMKKNKNKKKIFKYLKEKVE